MNRRQKHERLKRRQQHTEESVARFRLTGKKAKPKPRVKQPRKPR